MNQIKEIVKVRKEIKELVGIFSDSVQNSWYVVERNLEVILRDRYSPWFFETPMCLVSLHLIDIGIRETAKFAQKWLEDSFPPLVLELIIKLNRLKSQIKQLTQSAD